MVSQKIINEVNNILNSTDEDAIRTFAGNIVGYLNYTNESLEDNEFAMDFAFSYTFGSDSWKEVIFNDLILLGSRFEEHFTYVEKLMTVNIFPNGADITNFSLYSTCISQVLKKKLFKTDNVFAIKYLELFIKFLEQIQYYKYNEDLFVNDVWSDKKGYQAIEFITSRFDSLKNLHFDLTGSREFYDDTTIYSFYDLVGGRTLYQKKLPMINALKVLLVKAKEITKVT